MLWACCFADDAVTHRETSEQFVPVPWLTGPLIIPPATVVQVGHFTIETYVFATTNTGIYDGHWRSHGLPHNFVSVTPSLLTMIGMTEWMDFQIIPEMFYNTTHNQSSARFGDLPAGFDFQLCPAGDKPGIKFTILETFPTGQYQKLNPRKQGTDLSGRGSYATNLSLEFYKVYHLHGFHFVSVTAYFEYTYSAPVHVKGFNAYGGGYHTRGKVFPGSAYQGIVSFEFSLNRNWALALDNVYIHTNRSRFSGYRGVTDTGEPATVGTPSSEQISFAPGIEYNFSANLGIIAGAWVTALGRNSTQFRSGVVEFNYSY